MDTMNDEQLEALPPIEREQYAAALAPARHRSHPDFLASWLASALEALADARLEVARLTEERDLAIENGAWVWRYAEMAVSQWNIWEEGTKLEQDETTKMLRERDQQREDIRRLMEALRLLVEMHASKSSGFATLLVKMKERYA